MRRREFIAGLGAAAWPVAGRTQQSALPVIGVLAPGGPAAGATFAAGVSQGLKEAGFVVGQNLAIEFRRAEDQNDRLLALALELARRRVAVIIAAGTPAALAAKAATTTIPIAFLNGSDPVQIGLVASLARPNGNITGITNIAGGLIAKRFELLHQLVPAATSIAILVNPANPVIADAAVIEARTAAHSLGVSLLVVNGRSADEIGAAVASLGEQRVGALLVSPDPFYFFQIEHITALAAHYAMPTGYEDRRFAAAGGLMSYGPNILESNRQLGALIGRILKGEKPADIPVEQPTKFELAINLKTVKGLTIPPNLLALADEVIE